MQCHSEKINTRKKSNIIRDVIFIVDIAAFWSFLYSFALYTSEINSQEGNTISGNMKFKKSFVSNNASGLKSQLVGSSISGQAHQHGEQII
jgi:hypothetical protein